MKAAVVHGVNDIRYEDVETPNPGAGEILVKVAYTGICGSDIPRVNADACHFYPNILGHEFSGSVAAVGDGVSDFEVDDKVAGIPLLPCMNCTDCKNGDYSLCKNYKFIGSSVFGSFANYVVLPANNVVKFDGDVPYETAAFFEPATVSMHAVKRLGIGRGCECGEKSAAIDGSAASQNFAANDDRSDSQKSAAILGAGTIGIFLLQ